jgi:hypothetical protein
MADSTLLGIRKPGLGLIASAAARSFAGLARTATACVSRHKRTGGLLVSVMFTAVAGITAAVVSYSVTTESATRGNEEKPSGKQQNDGALLVHSQLMQVRNSRDGVPVLRFVECRHYPKERNKLIQAGFTSSGAPVLRFVPGDYCIFTGTEITARKTTTVDLRPQSVIKPQTPVENVSVPVSMADMASHGFSRALTNYQQYACDKFGPACRIALAIQAAENANGACEAYHYNADGSLDWGYFQINTVHLTRRGVNLRDLLDCKANIDFAYQLYKEEGFEPWTTYTSGQYRKFLDGSASSFASNLNLRHRPESLLIAGIDGF